MGLRKLGVLILLVVYFTAESEGSALRPRSKREKDFSFEEGTATDDLVENLPSKPIKPLIWKNDREELVPPGGDYGHAVHPVPEPPEVPEKVPSGWKHHWEDLKHKARTEWDNLKHKTKAKWHDTKQWFGNWWHGEKH